MSTTIDLSKYKVTDVFAKKVSESTLKAITNFEQKFNFENFLKENETKDESESVIITNADIIIAKIEAEREELLQKLLIYKRFLNYDVVKELSTQKLKLLYKIIKDLISNSFLYVKGDKKILFIYDEEKEDFVLYEKEMFIEKIENTLEEYGLLTKDIKEKRNGDVELVTKLAINVKRLYTNLKLKLKEVSSVNIKTDLFADKVKFEINEYDKEVNLIKNKIKIFKPNEKVLKKVTSEEKKEIIQDYRNLWDGGEKLDDMMNLIIYSRFIESRKNLQLNINAPSDWGKGFLMKCLEELGIGLKIKQEQMKNDRPSGLNIEKVRNATVLLLDEFKKYNNYLFEINNTLDIEAKFGSIYTVDVFLRLFLNAQKSESLTGYVNEQITNRIHLMEIKTHNLLKNSKVQKKYGKKIYKEVIKEYFYNFFTEKFNKLIKLGDVEAEKLADSEANKILAKYKIKTKSTEQLIVDTIIEFLEDYKKYLELKAENAQDVIFKKYTKAETDLFERFVFYNENTQKFQLIKYEDTIINILKERLAERDFKKVEYSRAELKEIFEKFLKAEYKKAYISELKDRKYALVIKEQNIYKYEEKNEQEQPTSVTETDSVVHAESVVNNIDEIDLFNANISYSANILKNFEELKNDKNKMLLLTTLNTLLISASTLQNFSEIYNTKDTRIIIRNFIKDKAELLKTLQLYKNENYIQQKLQNTTNAYLLF